MYDVRLSASATRFYENSDKILVKRINKAMDTLKTNPWKHGSIKRLSGPLSGYMRLRMGDYRVVYSVEESRKEVMVVVIAKREEVYRKMGNK